MTDREQFETKRPYAAPELVVHGTVEELTHGKAGGKKKGGGKPKAPRS